MHLFKPILMFLFYWWCLEVSFLDEVQIFKFKIVSFIIKWLAKALSFLFIFEQLIFIWSSSIWLANSWVVCITNFAVWHAHDTVCILLFLSFVVIDVCELMHTRLDLSWWLELRFIDVGHTYWQVQYWYLLEVIDYTQVRIFNCIWSFTLSLRSIYVQRIIIFKYISLCIFDRKVQFTYCGQWR